MQLFKTELVSRAAALHILLHPLQLLCKRQRRVDPLNDVVALNLRLHPPQPRCRPPPPLFQRPGMPHPQRTPLHSSRPPPANRRLDGVDAQLRPRRNIKRPRLVIRARYLHRRKLLRPTVSIYSRRQPLATRRRRGSSLRSLPQPDDSSLWSRLRREELEHECGKTGGIAFT